MDCQEVRELLDAYALGGVERGEAEALEAHVADCVRCWEELNEAQRAAALLALAVAIEEAPPALRERVLARAEREGRRERRRIGLWSGLKRRWPAMAGALAAVAVAALAFGVVLQVQMSDLQDENSGLEQQVRNADAILGAQRQMLAILSAPDTRELSMRPSSSASQAAGVYYWSPGSKGGFVVGNNLPELEEGQVYQVWYLTEREATSLGTFESRNGTGELPMDLSGFDKPPEAIGISIEEAGGSDRPTGEMFLYASLPER